MQTEKNIWLRVLSMILTLALLISCVPNQVYAMAGEAMADWLNATDTAVLQPDATPDPVLSTAHIVAEDESRRGETYKEYIMNNGLRLATVYPTAIHYEANGEWKDIDNTLVTAVSDGKAVYQNAAGAWNVRFPRTLSGNDMVGVTKDGYTVQFGMAGELRSTGDVAVASVVQIGATADTLAVSNAQNSVAQIQQIDLTAACAAAEHPETVLEKLNSRLSYANVYPNTNVVYDLQGNRLKESVVMQRYDADLWGYRYTLDTGDLVPVLREDQQIDLCHPETDEVILTMPAPYMMDDNGKTSYDVEVSLTRNGSKYLLSYYLPRAWLADADRAWPVILDPAVTFPGHYSNVDDITVAENYNEDVGRAVIQCGYSANAGAMRFYMKFIQLPNNISSADVIVDATIRLNKPYNSGTTANISVHKITEEWSQSTISWANQPAFDTDIEDFVVCKLANHYTWNITDMVRDWYEKENNGMVFKVPKSIETGSTENWKQFYSSEFSFDTYYIPLLTITYQNHNGLEDYWSYNSSSAGRAGTGYVDLFTGNLVWVRNDLGFDGNRMPVSIRHIYNSNDSQTNQFGMGYGWRTNYNQTITSSSGVYAWEDGDGTRHYFYQAKDAEDNNISNTYLDEDGLHLTLTTGGSGNQTYQLTDQLGNKSYFDATGRLRKIESNQQVKSNIEITYTADNLIDTIEDGVDRVYQFHYQSGLLDKISYLGSGNTELAYVTYAYTNSNLTRVTDKDGRYTSYTYVERLLSAAYDISPNTNDGDIEYYVTYAYTEDTEGNPVTPVEETEEYKSMGLADSLSGHYTFDYYAHYTKVRDINDKDTNYQFNDFGNLVAAYNSDGHVQFTTYAINDVHELRNNLMAPTAELHQVLGISDIDGTSNNLLSNGSFEDSSLSQTPEGWDGHGKTSSDLAYRGSKSMRLSATDNNDMLDVYGPSFSIEPGETYTFSAYIYSDTSVENVQATISFSSGSDSNYTRFYMDKPGWTRVQISYTNEENEPKMVYPRISATRGTIYIDCIQVEKTGTASPYNEVVNGDFLSNGHISGNWVANNETSSANYHNDTEAPNLLLSSGSIGLDGDPTSEEYFVQHIPISGGAGDSFVLSGWAKANALPVTESRQFGMKLIFHNRDNTETVFYSSFDPDIGSDNWQYAALTAVADNLYTFITIQLVYNFQANKVRFDGIQLTEGRAGTTYTYDVNKNVVEETNILGQITKYEYHDNGVDLEKITPSVGSIVHYEEYDAYHNVIKMNEAIKDESGTDHTVIYEYAYDDYGNVTSVTVTQGSLKLKSTTAYTSDGNYIKATTDDTGKTTRYGYHLQTGVLKWVQYPEDTPGTADTEDIVGTEGTEPTEYIEDTPDTRTYYAYDEMFRLIKTHVTTDKNASMSVEYGYENDLLKTLTTQSTIYAFAYNDYNLRASVSIGDQELAEYTYNSKHYLTQLDFANENSVKYKYDSLGRVTREEYYEDGNTTTPSRTIRYYYDNGGALARMKDSATRIETVCVYDYAGRVGVYLETDPNNNTYREIVYSYDENGNVTKINETVKEYRGLGRSVVVDTSIYTYEYLYDDKNRLETVKTHDGQKDYLYDDLDRLTEETVKTSDGTEVLSNEYTYKDATEYGTSFTTNQVESKTTTAAHYTSNLVYTYDDNGNITAIRDGTDANAKEITYEYDSANQLIRENNPYEDRTWVWTYDAAGNILSKKEYAYTLVETDELGNAPKTYAYGYGNSDWGDLLTSYDGRTFIYDDCTDLYDFKCGNLTDDGIWTYTWKQGRQLASMSRKDNTEDWSFEYDANGMRLKRTTGTDADDVTYTYVYTDGLLTRMTKGDIMLYFTYDAAGMPLTVSLHKGTNCKVKKGEACGTDCKTYYYVTNLQGDVIAILDETGNEVAEYSYDAWGRLLCNLDEDEETIYSLNPLLYRGYVYDRETNLYYLQSRYYNPEIGRFISADSYMSTGDGVLGNNMFAYCLNNPVNYADPTGHMPEWAKWVVGGLAVTGLVVATVLTCGAAGAGAAAVGAAMLAGGIISGGINAIDQLNDTGTIDLTELAISTLSGTAYGLVVGLTGGTAAGTFSAGAFVGKLAVAGGTSLLNSWNEDKFSTDPGGAMASFGLSLAISATCQVGGYYLGKAASLLPRDPNRLLTLGDIGSYLWGVPAIKTGVIRAVSGAVGAIMNDFL